MKHYSIRLVTLAMTSLLVLSWGCGNSPTEVEVVPEALTINPSTGAPGTIIALSGFTPTTAQLDELTARVAGLESAVLLSPTGQLLTAVPFMAAGTDGQSPPASLVDVELFSGENLVATARGALLVESLTPAPGATRSTETALSSIGVQMARISDLLHSTVSVEEQWTTSFSTGLETLISGSDRRSLESALARLEQESPETLALLDAYLASSGVLARTQDFAASLQAITLSASAEEPRLKTATGQLALARKMQFYSLLKLFGETVVHETAEEYAYTVGLVTGLIGIGAAVPAAGEIAAILAVADFAVNKVVVGLYPSEITDFRIALADTSLNLGDITTAQVVLAAKNNPPGVGIQDFVGLTLNLIGLRAIPATANFREILTGTAAFYLATVQQFIGTYSDANPGANLDVSMSLIPNLSWETIVTDSRLVDCKSHTPTTVTGLTSQVNWQASTTAVGRGRIYAVTSTDPGALLLTLPPLFTYSGGAFGEQVKATDAITVSVTGQLALRLDFPSRLQEGESSQLTVTAGYLNPTTGAIVGIGGIRISVVVDGGTVVTLSGSTSASGVFTTIAGADLGSSRLLLSVTARDDAFNSVTKSLDVAVGSSGVTITSQNISGSAVARATAQGKSDVAVDDQFTGSSANLNATAAATNLGATANAQATLTATASASENATVTTLSSTAQSNTSASYSVPSTFSHLGRSGAGVGWSCGFSFEIVATTVDYTLEMNFVSGNAADPAAQSGVSFSGSGGTNFLQVLDGTGGSASGVLQPGIYSVTYVFGPSSIDLLGQPGDPPTASRNMTSSGGFTLTLTK